MKYRSSFETGDKESSQKIDGCSIAKKIIAFVDTSAFISFLDKSKMYSPNYFLTTGTNNIFMDIDEGHRKAVIQ